MTSKYYFTSSETRPVQKGMFLGKYLNVGIYRISLIQNNNRNVNAKYHTYSYLSPFLLRIAQILYFCLQLRKFSISLSIFKIYANLSSKNNKNQIFKTSGHFFPHEYAKFYRKLLTNRYYPKTLKSKLRDDFSNF
jgi:hypothetical protein